MNQRVLFTVLKTSYLKNKLCLINFLIQNPPSLITTDHYRQCKTQKKKKGFKKIVHTNFMKFHSFDRFLLFEEFAIVGGFFLIINMVPRGCLLFSFIDIWTLIKSIKLLLFIIYIFQNTSHLGGFRV